MAIVWTIVGILVPGIVSVALGMLSQNPPDFRTSRLLCWTSFGTLILWSLVWLFLTPSSMSVRIYVILGVGAANLLGFPACLAYIAKRQSAYVAPAPAEPPALELAEEEVVDETDVSIKPSDPRVTISVEHLQERGITPATGVIIKNVGGSEAHNLRLADFKAAKHKITFPSNIPVLAPGETTQPVVPTIKHFGALQLHDMARAMMDDWGNQEEGIPEILYFPAFATYDDHSGNRFN